MFETDYIFKETAVVCLAKRTTVVFSKESNIYSYLKRLSQNAGWKFLRVDTTNQMGFPDILLLKGNTYWQIEAKLLKKKKLVTIEDDLKFQFGQLAYMKRALTLNLNYALVVAKDTTIAFITGATNEETKRSDYTNIIRFL